MVRSALPFELVVCAESEVVRFSLNRPATIDAARFGGQGEYRLEAREGRVSVRFPKGVIVNGTIRNLIVPSLAGGELIEIGRATGLVVPIGRPVERSLSWGAHTYLLANSKPAVLFRLALLGHAALTVEVLERVAKMTPEECAGHEALLNEAFMLLAAAAAESEPLRAALSRAVEGVEVVRSAGDRRPPAGQSKRSILSPQAEAALAGLGAGAGAGAARPAAPGKVAKGARKRRPTAAKGPRSG